VTDFDRLRFAPLDGQTAAFCSLVLRNPVVAAIVERMPALDLPGAYLAAGGLFQTVWNVLSGRPVGAGINDYDLLYFDDSDLSYEAEDQWIRRAADAFSDLPAVVEVRNEARVHLWYEQKFGVPCAPFVCVEDAISRFAATTCAVGITPVGHGLQVCAPYGFTDLFALVVRPNPVLAPRHVYEAKATRWRSEWPQLTVLPWPE
jgi:hypothetical protein